MKKVMIVLMLALLSILVFAEEGDSDILTVSLVNQDPDPALAGDIVELRIGIENRGGQAVEDLVVELLPEYPFTMVPGEDAAQRVGTISAYQYEADVKIIKFKIRVDQDANAGSYELKLNYFEESKSYTVRRSINIDVKSRESAEVIYIDQVELLPGQITPMQFTINNVGSAPLRDLTFTWENEDGVILPVSSDDTKFIKYIDIGESAELVYSVIASGNAEPDLYKLNLKLTYDDPITNEEKEITTKAGVYVGGETDFDITYSGSSNGETSFSVSNIGSVPANSVTVTVPDQRGWRISGSDSVIIGNLNKGDYTIASFKLQVPGMQTTTDNDRPGGQPRTGQTPQRSSRNFTSDTPIKVEVHYTDTRGNRHIVSKEVDVDSQSIAGAARSDGQFAGRSRNTSQTNWTHWIVIVLVVVILWYLHGRYKKGKLADPSFRFVDIFKK